MDIDWQTVIAAAVGAAGGGGLVGAVVRSVLDSLLKRMQALSEEVKALREKEVASLAARLSQVESRQAQVNVPLLTSKIDTLSDLVHEIDGKVDQLVQDHRATQEALGAAKNYISGVSEKANRISDDVHRRIDRETEILRSAISAKS